MPKKSTLFQFSRYTRDSVQRRRLQELSSRQGNEEYQNLILNQNITICDIIRLFDSCHPPLNVFLDNVPASKPRYYSIANIPEIKVHHDESTGEFRRQTHFRIILSIANQFSHTFMRASENLLGHFSGKFFRVSFLTFDPKAFFSFSFTLIALSFCLRELSDRFKMFKRLGSIRSDK